MWCRQPAGREGLAGAHGGFLERGWRPEGSYWQPSHQCRSCRRRGAGPVVDIRSAAQGVRQCAEGCARVFTQMGGAQRAPLRARARVWRSSLQVEGHKGSAAGAGSQRVGQEEQRGGSAQRSDQKPHPGPCGPDLGGAWHGGRVCRSIIWAACFREGVKPGRARRGRFCAQLCSGRFFREHILF